MFEIFGHASIAGKLGMVVAVATVAFAGAYAIRPSELRLSLIRPLSLATIFAALFSFTAGVAQILMGISHSGPAPDWQAVAAGAAESLGTLVSAFGCLAVVWILVAIGFRRH
jgi:hypothetical protein